MARPRTRISDKEIRVRAVLPPGKIGFDPDGFRRYNGDVFTLRDREVAETTVGPKGIRKIVPGKRRIQTAEEQVSQHWMVVVDENEEETPLVGAQAALNRAQDEITSSRRPA